MVHKMNDNIPTFQGANSSTPTVNDSESSVSVQSANNSDTASDDKKEDSAPAHGMTFIQGKSTGDPNTHGIELPRVGGGIMLTNPKIPGKIAAAAVNQEKAVIVIDGQAFDAPMMEINPDMVELACSAKGCALVARDDNPLNDVAPVQVQALFESLMSKKSSQ